MHGWVVAGWLSLQRGRHWGGHAWANCRESKQLGVGQALTWLMPSSRLSLRLEKEVGRLARELKSRQPRRGLADDMACGLRAKLRLGGMREGLAGL